MGLTVVYHVGLTVVHHVGLTVVHQQARLEVHRFGITGYGKGKERVLERERAIVLGAQVRGCLPWSDLGEGQPRGARTALFLLVGEKLMACLYSVLSGSQKKLRELQGFTATNQREKESAGRRGEIGGYLLFTLLGGGWLPHGCVLAGLACQAIGTPTLPDAPSQPPVIAADFIMPAEASGLVMEKVRLALRPEVISIATVSVECPPCAQQVLVLDCGCPKGS